MSKLFKLVWTIVGILVATGLLVLLVNKFTQFAEATFELVCPMGCIERTVTRHQDLRCNWSGCHWDEWSGWKNESCTPSPFKNCESKVQHRIDCGEWVDGNCPPPPVLTHLECVENACMKVEGDSQDTCETDEDCIIPPPTPTPTNTPVREESKPEGCTTNCNPPAPQCSAELVVKEPANFHLYRNGSDALLKWVATAGNKVLAFWKHPTDSNWEHSTTSENTGYLEIHSLGSDDWTFGLEQVNDCGGGIITTGRIMEVVDGNTRSWVLFR